MSKELYIATIRPGQTVQEVFLCTQKAELLGKTNQPYLNIDLTDKTGSCNAKVWDNVDQISKLFEEGDLVEVRAQAITFNNKLQLRIQRIRKVDDSQIDPADFFPTSAIDPNVMLTELKELVVQLEQEDIRRVILSFLEDEDFARRYIRTPAAKTIHHSYLGGLLEHTLSLAKLARQVAAHYPEVDESMLVAGVFFHDLGKVRELQCDRTIAYTDEGRLIGHMILGVELFHDKVRELGDFPDELKMLITHMILAHHGQLEFGSPKRPKTIEAMVLAALDDLDARIYSFHSILENETKVGRWSTYQKMYDRYLYRWNGPEKLGENHMDSAESDNQAHQEERVRDQRGDSPMRPAGNAEKANRRPERTDFKEPVTHKLQLPEGFKLGDSEPKKN